MRWQLGRILLSTMSFTCRSHPSWLIFLFSRTVLFHLGHVWGVDFSSCRWAWRFGFYPYIIHLLQFGTITFNFMVYRFFLSCNRYWKRCIVHFRFWWDCVWWISAKSRGMFTKLFIIKWILYFETLLITIFILYHFGSSGKLC